MNIFKKLKFKLFYFDKNLTTEVFKGDHELCSMDRAHILADRLQRNGIKYMRRDPDNGRIILMTPEGISVGTDKYLACFDEVFFQKLYELEERYIDEPFAVFDLGLNRAYATLFYSTYPNCKVIYGYEPHPDTYKFAEYNLKLNLNYFKNHDVKVAALNYGLGASDSTITLLSIPGRDGVSTVEGCSNSAVTGKAKVQMKITAEIHNASNEFSKRMEEPEIANIRKIMKIDVEGAEYDIIDDLCKTDVIRKFDLIIGDSHNGIEPLKNNLSSKGFSLIHIGYGVEKCQEFIFQNNQTFEI